ncbi:MAG: hypothetical protein LBB75_02400 [Oscillospiraceae bacterium]|nr:hypothetical protein [Oscillospiraceae bacterium]
MPPSAYLIRGRARGVYAVNISFLAPWNGIDFQGCDGHLIKKITCYALHNMHNGNAYRCSYDFPEWHHSEGGDFGLIFDSTSRVQTDVLRIEGARDQTVLNTISFGARTLIDAENSEGTLVVNGGSLIAVNELRSRGRLFEAREGARVSVCNPDETA